jgi:hypothetical protein
VGLEEAEVEAGIVKDLSAAYLGVWRVSIPCMVMEFHFSGR